MNEMSSEASDRLRTIKESFVAGLLEQLEFCLLDMRESIGELRRALNAVLSHAEDEEAES